MTLNLHNGLDTGGTDNTGRFIKLVAEEQPDLIALQEVEDNVIARLNKTGYHVIHEANANLGWFRFGNALLTRHPIIHHRHHYLPSQLEQRGMLEAAVSIDGQTIQVFNTHLGLSHADRGQQLDAITQALASSGTPFILMGDFNAEPRSGLFSNLLKFTSEVGSVIPLDKSFPARNPSVRIDQIWYSRHWQATAAKTLPWHGSDHLPVTATLSLKTWAAGSLPEVPYPVEANPPDSSLLPDPTRLHFQVAAAYTRTENGEGIPFSFTMPLHPKVSLDLETNGDHPGLTLNLYKMLDLRDYASLIGVRGLGHWRLGISAANNRKPWLKWGQYYRWGPKWGTRITGSTQEDHASWEFQQIFLPSPRLSFTVGADTNGAVTLETSFANNSQVSSLGWQYEDSASTWYASWSYRW